jgi:hypothetical protein
MPVPELLYFVRRGIKDFYIVSGVSTGVKMGFFLLGNNNGVYTPCNIAEKWTIIYR